MVSNCEMIMALGGAHWLPDFGTYPNLGEKNQQRLLSPLGTLPAGSHALTADFSIRATPVTVKTRPEVLESQHH